MRCVYTLKSLGKAKKRKEKRQMAGATSKNAGIGDPVELISGIKALAHTAGGMRTLKQLVDLQAE
jgi:hypothetical protein